MEKTSKQWGTYVNRIVDDRAILDRLLAGLDEAFEYGYNITEIKIKRWKSAGTPDDFVDFTSIKAQVEPNAK